MQTIDEAREHGIVGKGIEKMEHGRVQLWEGGPFWAETNIGEPRGSDPIGGVGVVE